MHVEGDAVKTAIETIVDRFVVCRLKAKKNSHVVAALFFIYIQFLPLAAINQYLSIGCTCIS